MVGMICSLGMWADTAYLYMDGTTGANSMTLKNGFIIAITGNSEKAFSNGGGKITLSKTEYQTMKNSNGAQITVTCPTDKVASHIDFYVVTNDASTKAKLQEFDGATTSDEVASLKDYANPTKISKDIANKSSFTFTFGTKQVCFVAVVTYAADVKAAPTVSIPSTADAYTNVASSISATITANPAVSGIKWYSCDDAEKTNPVEVAGQTTAKLSYTIATAGTYYYYCAATNDKGTTNSDVCAVTVTAKPVSTECKLTNLVLSNGCNTAIKDNTITGYYMKGEAAPTIKSATISEYASYNLDGTKFTVTAEDGTTKTEYTYNVTEVEPLTSTEAQTVNVTTPSWLKFGVLDANNKKSHEIYKSIDEAKNMRITEAKNRAYLFVGPCDAVVLTNSSSGESSDRTGTYSVNGAAATEVSFPKYNNGAVTFTIPCSSTGNNMIEIVNTATGGSWGFDAVQLVNYPKVTFSCTDASVVGKTPVSQKVKTATMTIPTNVTLYKEGYTLTAWNDGTDDYAPGATYTPTGDFILTPVFTKNTQNIKYRNAEVTVKWDGNTYNAYNAFTYQGNSGVYVTQATVNGEKIDVALQANATSGKFGNNTNGWCQCNGGTKLSFIGAKDAVVTLKTYNPVTSSTFNGKVPTGSGSSGNYTYNYTATADGDIEFVSGGDLAWLGYLQVVLPANTPTPSINALGYGTFSCAANVQIVGAKVYKAAMPVSGDKLVCTEIESGKVPAGTGVLLYKEGATEASTATALYVDEADAIGDNILMATTLADGSLAIRRGVYALSLSGDTFMEYSGSDFVAGKAYIQLGSINAKSFTIVFEGDTTTAINNVNVNANANGAAYNLAGQRVNAGAKGIVIVNGKKYINK